MSTAQTAHGSPLSAESLYDGVVLVIDKPIGWTSFDVVNKLKWIVLRHLPTPDSGGQKRRFKIGHAGTLDPLATGLLVVCTGRMTKSISELQSGIKTYTGVIRMGQTTPSYDLETEPEGDYPYDHLSIRDLEENASTFLGPQLQTPPVFSAKWVDGKRAYESARKGEAVEMRKAAIEIFSFRILSVEGADIRFETTVSKGTYIRSLAHDFGQRLGTASHLAELRRTSSEPFSEGEMETLDDVITRIMAVSDSSTS